MLRTGPYGDGFGADPDGLSLAKLEANPHGIDLGPLEPRIPGVLRTPTGMIELAPEICVADVERLRAVLDRPLARDGGPLVLVGRRDLRSNNSWMHNLPVLVKGKARCTVHVHPDDAARLGFADGVDGAGELVGGGDRAPGRGDRRRHAGRREHPARLGSRRRRHADPHRDPQRRARTRTCSDDPTCSTRSRATRCSAASRSRSSPRSDDPHRSLTLGSRWRHNGRAHNGACDAASSGTGTGTGRSRSSGWRSWRWWRRHAVRTAAPRPRPCRRARPRPRRRARPRHRWRTPPRTRRVGTWSRSS